MTSIVKLRQAVSTGRANKLNSNRQHGLHFIDDLKRLHAQDTDGRESPAGLPPGWAVHVC